MTELTLKVMSNPEYSAQPFILSWMDGETRCHVWIDDAGNPEGWVHRNAPNGETWRGDQKWRHSQSDLQGKKYAPIRDHIAALTSQDFDAAAEEWRAAERARDEQEQAERDARDLETLHNLADRFGFELVKKQAAA